MSWWQTGLSIVSTLGNIAGALAGNGGALNDKGTVRVGFGPKMGTRIADGTDVYQIEFNADGNGNIHATNNDQNNPVEIFFPPNRVNDANNLGEAILLTPLQSFDCTLAFNSSAGQGIDNLLITPTTPDSDDFTNPKNNAQIRSSARNIPRSNLAISIGNFVTVKLSSSTRVVTVAVVGALTLAAIIVCDVQGAGKTTARILGRPNSNDGDDTSTSIDLTIPFGVDIDNGLNEIDIVLGVNVTSFDDLLASYPEEWRDRFGTVDPSHYEYLEG